jgi:lipoprotein-releasing system permease protein
MFTPVETFIAWRYTRAQRRTQLVSLVSAISISGVALGIAALLTILSIMNGFEREMRERLLGMTAHLEIRANDGELREWQQLGAALGASTAVIGWAPYVEGQALLTRFNAVQGAQVRGIDPVRETRVSVLGKRLQLGSLEALQAGKFRVVVGRGIADALRLTVGDDVMLVLAEPLRTASGMLPRLKRFEVAGIFEAGVQEFDSATVFVHLEDAQRVFRRYAGVDGLRVKLTDPFAADTVGAALTRTAGAQALTISSWTTSHANLFRALETEKIVMFVILLLSVAVAAFNLVSTLVMVVTEKTAEIAILQTLGLTPRQVLRVFFTQGAMIGAAGVTVGALGGVLLATNIERIIAWLEAVLGFKILAPDVYYISHIPAMLEPLDVWLTLLFSFVLCFVAPLYPAWLASRTRPAEVLRYE